MLQSNRKLYKFLFHSEYMENVNVDAGDLKRLIIEVNQIKKMLLAEKEKREIEEIELTDWAKNELKRARETSEEKYISHNEVKRIILAK